MRPSSAALSISRTLWAAFAVPLVCLLAAGVVGTAGLALGVRGFEALVHNEVPLLTANDDILQALTDAETAERGYLVTGDRVFLQPYDPARAAFLRALEEARSHDREGRVTSLLDAQLAAGTAWFEEFGDPIIALRETDADAATALAATGAGRERIAALRELNHRTELAIRDDLDARLDRVRWTALLAAVVLCGLVLLAFAAGARIAARATGAVTGPLQSLVRVLQRLRSGDYSARVAISGPAEIEAVAAAVNELAASADELTRAQQRRLEVGQRVRRVSAQLHRSLDVDRVLEVVTAELGSELGDRAVARRTVGEDHRVVVQWCAEGVQELPAHDGLGFPAGLRTLILEAAERHQRAVIVTDTATDPRMDADSRRFLDASGIRSCLAGAVRAGPDEVIIIAVHVLHEPRPWDEHELALFDGLVREAATAIANAVAFGHQQRVVDRLEQLDRDKTVFMSNVSHELRTPLTSIMGYLELLQEGDAGEMSPEQLGLLSTIDRNSKRLLDQIEDLLILSRIEGGTFTMAREPVALGSLVHDVATSLRPQFRARGVELAVDVAADLGETIGDERQLERVLLNLLSNAVKFTEPGGQVDVEGRLQHDMIELQVTDTGIGVPQDEQHRLFERFFRSSVAQARAIQGTGLGLAISKTIVDRHGGTLAATSTLGRGTTLSLRLPLTGARSTEGTAPCLSSPLSS